MKRLFCRIFDLYYDGFTQMKLGKTLWTVILVKLFIMFAVLKLFFFPDFLNKKAPDGGKADYVSNELIERGGQTLP